MDKPDKNHPTAEWIEELRERFPCETEIDRVLTRKLLRRSGPGYSPVALDTLVQGLEALLRVEIGEGFEIAEPRWLTGGASKLQMAFHLTWNQPGVGRTTSPMVLRMEPSEAIVETSRLREFQLIKAFEGHVPIPRAHWIDADGKFFPYPAIVYGFVQGVAKPSQAASGVTGIGIKFRGDAREALGAQFIDHLACIHLFDWTKADLGAFDKPELGTEAVEWQLNWWERVWEEDSHQDAPLMRLAMAWLRLNMPPIDRISVVHGDYRPGNFLYTEHDNKMSALLDWELGHLGDRHEDIAYAMIGWYGHMADDAATYLISGFLPESEYFKAYEKASGLSINPKTVDYYRVLNAYKVGVIVNATGYRIADARKTHQDVLVAWLIGINAIAMTELRDMLEKVM